MLAGMRVAVVVPAHNEERHIERTLRAIPAWVDHVVVIDDASADRTRDAALGCADGRTRVITHERNRGVGASLVTGYREAFGAGADVAVVMAGDAQMHPGDLPALVAPVLAGRADYAKGNRLAHPQARRCMPLSRWVGNQVLSVLTRWATGLAVHDSQCGYTALSREGAERLPLASLWPRYGYPNDLLGHAAASGLRVEDVLVRPVYADETSGVRLWHAGVVIPALLLRVAGRRLFAVPVEAPRLPDAGPGP
jgi:glycosyltransferase involved in cell wall biosynthesis